MHTCLYIYLCRPSLILTRYPRRVHIYTILFDLLPLYRFGWYRNVIRKPYSTVELSKKQTDSNSNASLWVWLKSKQKVIPFLFCWKSDKILAVLLCWFISCIYAHVFFSEGNYHKIFFIQNIFLNDAMVPCENLLIKSFLSL